MINFFTSLSPLAPWFALGFLGLSLPIIFHLIRRTPRGQQQFSSLMFLSPSPPRLTRRSRLDNLLLLLLRAAALALIVLAFMRIFFRENDDLALQGVRGRNVAIMIDTSASMRQGDLWQQAVARAELALEQLEPADDVALFAFDRQVRMLVEFDRELNTIRKNKPDRVRARLAELAPTWSTTELGTSLIAVADTLDVNKDLLQTDAALQVVLITDMQEGAQIQSLQAFEWPKDVQVAFEQVSLDQTSNASIQLLATDDSNDNEPRVRVTNAANSNVDQFYVRWSNAVGRVANPSHEPSAGRIGNPSYEEVAIYVPPGQSRVVRVPRPAASVVDRLVLTGDTCDFDNTLYVVRPRQKEITVVYLGSDHANDQRGLHYFLREALADMPQCNVRITTLDDGQSPALLKGDMPKLIVVTESVSATQLEGLEGYVKFGGTLLVVPKDDEAVASLASFIEPIEPDRQVKPASYAMLGEIDFAHPLFASFAAPQYSDFTKIRFWQSRQIDVKPGTDARVLARFDDGRPALWEQTLRDGKVFVLASGWHPADSQLAGTTKFVPLITGILEQAGVDIDEQPSFTTGELIPLPENKSQKEMVIHCPDGREWKVPRDAKTFDDADQPGIHQVALAGTRHEFAVNLGSTESDTAPIDVERLEQLGVNLGTHATKSEETERLRQLRDQELERKQSYWRWLIIGALCVLILETWLAGRTVGQISNPSGTV